MKNNLKSIREKRGMSQNNLAFKAGVTPSTVFQWEQGNNLSALIRVARLCHTLDCDIREIISLEDLKDL